MRYKGKRLAASPASRLSMVSNVQCVDRQVFRRRTQIKVVLATIVSSQNPISGVFVHASRRETAPL